MVPLVFRVTLIAALLSGCASQEPQSELYPHPPGSMGNPNAQTTALAGVTVLFLTAALIHTTRDR